jgi:hypothetical protein
MRKPMLSILALAALPGSALLAQNVVGTWRGTLQGPAGPALRIVMKITRADDESLKTVTYSIDQGAAPINASSTTQQGSVIKIALPAIGGSYEGRIGADGISMTGTWTQGPGPAPLNFARATPETAWTIPDPPPPPKLMAPDVTPEFEVATIKPSKPGTPGKRINVGRNGVLTTVNFSVSDLIQFAYHLHAKRRREVFLEDQYDITGKPDHEGIGNDRQTAGDGAEASERSLSTHFPYGEERALRVCHHGCKVRAPNSTRPPIPLGSHFPALASARGL